MDDDVIVHQMYVSYLSTRTCGILSAMSVLKPEDFSSFYARFQSPIARFDCGQKCAPYNENGVPFCCDTRHAVPTAYQAEWAYLRENTDLWKEWAPSDPQEKKRLQKETPNGQLLIACKGAAHCQRGFRSITCRAFPFFPYINSQGEFIGLSYYWDYEDRCWVISNLDIVTPEYRAEFIAAYEELFESYPEELESFRNHSAYMRKVFLQRRRTIPLLHKNGYFYKLSPGSEKIHRVAAQDLPKFGPYRIAAALPFPDEIA